MKTAPKPIPLAQVKGWFEAVVMAEAPGRERSEEEARLLNHDQWTQDERTGLEGRGQTPVAMNQVHQDYYIQVGRQIRNRMAPEAKPRGASDTQVAAGLTDVIRYLLNANLWDYVQTDAVKDQLVKVGWVKVGYQKEDLGREPIELRHIPRRHVYADPARRRKDLLDAKYVHEERWVDLEDAIAAHPEHEAALRAYVGNYNSKAKGSAGVSRESTAGDPYAAAVRRGEAELRDFVDKDRKRVRIVETWFRRSEVAQQVVWPDGRVERYDEAKPAHQQALQPAMVADEFGIPSLGPAEAELVNGPCQQVYFVIWIGDVVLAQGKSPYSHPYFPYVLYEAFRADVAQANEHLTPGECFGMLRVAKDPQKFINSLFAKLRFILGTRQVVMKSGTADRSQVEQNASNPAGIIETTGDPDDLQFVDQLSHAAGLERLIDMGQAQMQKATGVNEASRGEGPESSGRAMFARQQQSEVTNTILVDNQRHAIQQIGRMLVSMIQQSYRAEKIVRITEDAGDRLIAINVQDPAREAELRAQHRTVDEEGQEKDGITCYGDVSQGIYDVVVDEMEATATRREQDLEVLMTILEKLPPEFVVAMADILAESLDIRAKDKFIERAKAIQARLLGPPPGAMPPGPAGPPPGPPPDAAPPPMAPPPPGIPPEAALLDQQAAFPMPPAMAG